MVSLADVRAWNPGTLDEICSVLRTRAQILVNDGDDYGKILPVESWTGPAADNAAVQHKNHMQALDTYVAGVSALGKAVGQAADAILGVQAAIRDADELARKYGFAITADGAIVCVYAGQPPPDLHPQDRARAQQQLTDDVAQILRTADDIDTDLASVLDRAAAGQFGTGNETTVAAAAADGLKDPGLTLPEPPANATPAQNAAWWATLSKAGRDIMIRDRPGTIGAMDGLPGGARDRANRAVLAQQQADLQRQRADLQRRMDGLKMSDPQQQNEHHDLQVQLDRINDRLSELSKVDQALQLPGGRQLLVLDGSGEHLRAAVASGNVDTARNIVTFTGGLGSSVNGDLLDYDNRMDQIRQDADDMARKSGDGGKSAAVTWMGYDAPQSLDVLSTGKAENGAAKLAPFLEGLDASREGDPARLVALGHSYGSTTTGIALRHAGVDAAIFAGSPGLDTGSISDLKVPPGESYVLKNDGDPVATSGWFGTDPAQMPGVHHMSTDRSFPADGPPLEATTGHSSVEEYLRPGTTSQHNIAAVVANTPAERTLLDQPGFEYQLPGGR
ncbi:MULTISPECIES: alpha/beta hydrolase [unclassified Amycolatopsis]|uniref:alpha/beta hydrolase n=1 Tax=unclassified Amycolatopsis TaxID=2618356 RepID=UPI00106E260C|nr:MULTISPECIES: alpha/beta hydrolase [unclassified Amycolatopsis]